MDDLLLASASAHVSSAAAAMTAVTSSVRRKAAICSMRQVSASGCRDAEMRVMRLTMPAAACLSTSREKDTRPCLHVNVACFCKIDFQQPRLDAQHSADQLVNLIDM